VRTGDTYEVDGVMDFSTDDADLQGNPFEDQITQAFDTADLRIAITFPGEVLETNGKVDGTTVTWEPVFGERNVLTAVASASGDGATESGDGGDGTDAAGATVEDSGGDTLLYVIAGLVIVAIVVGLFLMMRRKGGGAPSAADAGGVSPAVPVTSPEPQAPTNSPSPPPTPPPPPVEPPDGGPDR
jgi:hypothetical protein